MLVLHSACLELSMMSPGHTVSSKLVPDTQYLLQTFCCRFTEGDVPWPA